MKRALSSDRCWSVFSAGLVYAFLFFGTVVMVLPFYWTLITSVKLPQETITYPIIWIPSKITFVHFQQAWLASFPIYYRNSAVTAVGVVVASLFTSALGGFIFAKYEFPLKSFWFMLVLSQMMIPFVVVLIPTYMIVGVFLGLRDTVWALILPAIVSPFGIFLMRQFAEGIPNELLDAGRIDGASDFRIFWQIIVPLCKPALTALAIFKFMWVWNDFLWPLIVTDSNRSRTLPIGIMTFASERWFKYNATMAASVLVLTPVVLFYLICQRAFVQGIVLTGLKY